MWNVCRFTRANGSTNFVQEIMVPVKFQTVDCQHVFPTWITSSQTRWRAACRKYLEKVVIVFFLLFYLFLIRNWFSHIQFQNSSMSFRVKNLPIALQTHSNWIANLVLRQKWKYVFTPHEFNRVYRFLEHNILWIEPDFHWKWMKIQRT